MKTQPPTTFTDAQCAAALHMPVKRFRTMVRERGIAHIVTGRTMLFTEAQHAAMMEAIYPTDARIPAL